MIYKDQKEKRLKARSVPCHMLVKVYFCKGAHFWALMCAVSFGPVTRFEGIVNIQCIQTSINLNLEIFNNI